MEGNLPPCGVVFPHVHGSGIEPDRVVDDAVHDGISMDATSQPGVPVILSVLRAEDGGSGVMPPFDQFEDEVLFGFGDILQQPFIQDQEVVGAVLLEDLHDPMLDQGVFLVKHFSQLSS